jgi:hypothetical protein
VEGSVEFVVDVAFPDASVVASEGDEENKENVFPNIPFPDASVTFPDASVTFPDASEDNEENNENGSKFG